MVNAYRRKKDPEANRLAILEAAAEIGAEGNWQQVTFQAIAARTGLSTGAIIYHFGNKDELMEALLRQLLAALAESITQQAGVIQGSRAFAYLSFVVSKSGDESFKKTTKVVMLAILSDEKLRKIWNDWFSAYSADQEPLNSNSQLLIIQLVADGLWCSDVLGLYDITEQNKREIVESFRNFK